MPPEIRTKRIGRSQAVVTQLGLGCAPLGDIGKPVSEEQAQKTFQAAWDAGIRYFDTSPFYGYGKSEHRLGTFLRQVPRSQFVVSTKVGRVLHAPRRPEQYNGRFWAGGRSWPWKGALPFEFHFDYTHDGVLRSYEDSLQRLSLNSIDLLVVHDLDRGYHSSDVRLNAYLSQLLTSGWRVLDGLRAGGEIKGIGLGINDVSMIPVLLDLVEPDFLLIGASYSLLDLGLLKVDTAPLAERGIGVVAGSVFATGILATGAVQGARAGYGPAKEPVMERVRRMEAVCGRYGVPIASAAMRFPFGHPQVNAIVPGATSPEQARSNAERFDHSIPGALWADLKAEGLLPPDARSPEGGSRADTMSTLKDIARIPGWMSPPSPVP